MKRVDRPPRPARGVHTPSRGMTRQRTPYPIVPCAYAEAFDGWCRRQIRGVVTDDSTVPEIYAAMVALQKQYYASRQTAERGHKDYTGAAHRCLYHTWLTNFEYLSERELQQTIPIALSGMQTAQPSKGTTGTLIGLPPSDEDDA